MIDLHYWPTPNGWKISIMLEECGLPYKLVPVNIGTGEQFKPEFLKISPNNRMPAIVDHEPPGGGAPVSVFESGAILQYLAEKPASSCPRICAASTRCCSGSTGRWAAWGRWPARPTTSTCTRRSSIRPRRSVRPGPLQQRGQPPVRRAQQAAGRPPVRGRRLFDRRHGDLAMGRGLQEFRPEARGLPGPPKWFEEAVGKRPAVVKGKAVGAELRQTPGINTDEQRKILFGQTASVVR